MNKYSNINLNKLKEGDSSVFKNLFYITYPKLIALALRYVDEEIAEDMVQDTYINLWKKRKKLDIENIQSYLYKCTQNNCLNWLAHQKVNSKYKTICNISNELLISEQNSSDHNCIYTNIDSKEIIKQIKKGVNKLPQKQAESFKLFFFNDLSHKEIAIIMNISVRTVDTHLYKATQFLRIFLKNLF